MNTIKVEWEVPKEGKEIVDAAHGLIKHFVLGKPLAEIAALLPAFIAAVDNYQALGEELKSQQADELVGYLVQQIWAALKAKQAVVQL